MICFLVGDRGRSGGPRGLAGICCLGFVWLLALGMILEPSNVAHAHAKHEHHHRHQARAEHHKHRSPATIKRNTLSIPSPTARPALANLSGDQAAAKKAIDLASRGEISAATTIEKSIADPVAQKLVEWTLLRRADGVGFQRYDAFITANPNWPGIAFLRQRAEAVLWKERADAATVRTFVNAEPSSTLGKLVLARVLASQNDTAGAMREVRSVWRSAPLSTELENEVLSAFPDMLSRADHIARMDKRVGAKDFAAGMRAAKRVGEDQVAIVKACSAAESKSANSEKLLDAVPERARDDLGYALCRIHWLLRNNSPGSNIHGRLVTPQADVDLAVRLVLAAPQQDLLEQDTDEWWRERRTLARKLLDLGEAATAYQVVAKSAEPANHYYRAEFHFMAGWIALRFLGDPGTAAKHFGLIDHAATDPRILARAAYWCGRAAEAAGQITQMRADYEAAGQYPTAYYGQLARRRLGLDDDVVLRPPPRVKGSPDSEILQAARILYAIDEDALALTFVSNVAKESNDIATIAALAKLAAQRQDARATLLIGKTALARGMPMDKYAFPDFGIPTYSAIGPEIDRSIVYSVARTESAFDQHDRSSADAVGLMQVTQEAGRDTAKRFGVSYNWGRLVTDPVYNTQMGAAELSALLQEYNGSYILTFAAYNAGRGRVQQWMALHGDPRDPKVDPVDWVERIPFAETRNYVERVAENLQVYRGRFDSTVANAGHNLQADGELAQPALLETGRH